MCVGVTNLNVVGSLFIIIIIILNQHNTREHIQIYINTKEKKSDNTNTIFYLYDGKMNETSPVFSQFSL